MLIVVLERGVIRIFSLFMGFGVSRTVDVQMRIRVQDLGYTRMTL